MTLASAPKSVCILRLSAIGDVTHILPIIATLHEYWPDTRVTWIIGKIEYQLVKSLPNIEFIVFDKLKGWSEYRQLRQQLKGRCFDILLMMQVALRTNLISMLIPAKRKIGFDKSRARDFHSLFCKESIDGPHRVHVLDTFFQFLEKAGIQRRRMDWLLKADPESVAYATGIMDDKPTVIINPCSSARKNNWRNWPESYYAEIIDYLIDKKTVQVILSGGPANEEILFSERVIALCQHKPLNLVGKTSLMQLLALLEQAQCLIAPDTGPAHMGTVAGIPVIGLFASSNPQRSGPYSSLANCVNAYPQALEKYNKNSLASARWGERIRHADVMKLIPVNAVLNQINKILTS